jgi:hypothetical protein
MTGGANVALGERAGEAGMKRVMMAAALLGLMPVSAGAQTSDEAIQAAQFRSVYGRCLYARQQAEAERFIRASDAGGYDEAALGKPRQVAMRWRPQQCLDAGLNALALRRLPDRLDAGTEDLRPMLLEAAYLARFRTGPTWIGKATPAAHTYVSKEKDLSRAQAADDFADCVVKAAPEASDALIRSDGGSANERAAVRQLSRNLGPCLGEGQKLTLNPTNLRRLLIEGLWTASNAAAVTPGRPAAMRTY